MTRTSAHLEALQQASLDGYARNSLRRAVKAFVNADHSLLEMGKITQTRNGAIQCAHEPSMLAMIIS